MRYAVMAGEKFYFSIALLLETRRHNRFSDVHVTDTYVEYIFSRVADFSLRREFYCLHIFQCIFSYYNIIELKLYCYT